MTYDSDSRKFYLLSLADTVSHAIVTNKVNWAMFIGGFFGSFKVGFANVKLSSSSVLS